MAQVTGVTRLTQFFFTASGKQLLKALNLIADKNINIRAFNQILLSEDIYQLRLVPGVVGQPQSKQTLATVANILRDLDLHYVAKQVLLVNFPDIPGQFAAIWGTLLGQVKLFALYLDVSTGAIYDVSNVDKAEKLIKDAQQDSESSSDSDSSSSTCSSDSD